MAERAHGGNVEELARGSGIGPGSIIDFSASINPLGYPPGVRLRTMESFDCILHYPDIDSYDLTRALADYHGIAPEHILVGNGSTEFIYWLPLLLRLRRGLIVTPAFSEYEKALRLAGAEVTCFGTRREDGFRLDIPALAGRLAEDIDILFLGNPANPSGVLADRTSLHHLISVAEKEGVTLVIDEAFIDFVEDESIVGRALESDTVIVLRSMTKFFGLPGLRVGYIVAHRSLIERIGKQKPPWTVNALAQRAATEALNDQAFIERSRTYVATERAFLHERLERIGGFSVTPGTANYLLVHINETVPLDAPGLRLRLLETGIAIRDCSNFRGLDGRFFRVAVKTRHDNLLLVDRLQETLAHPD